MKHTEKTYKFPNYEIKATSWGKGEPLFLIPGWPFSSKLYLFLKPYLSQKYRVTCIDLPGWSGNSSFKGRQNGHKVEDYLDIIENCIKAIYPNEKTISIGGTSAGGTLSLLLSKRLGSKVKDIIAISTPSGGSAIRKLHRVETSLMDFAFKFPSFGYFLMVVYALGKARVIKNNRSTIGRTLFKQFASDFIRIKPKSAIEFAVDFFGSEYESQFKDIKNKVVVIGNKKDNAVPPEMVRRLGEKILPNADYYELSNGTHASVVEYPKEISNYIFESLHP